jgi:hypothetical protein
VVTTGGAPASKVSAYSATCDGKLLAKVDSGAHGCDIFLSPENTVGMHKVQPVSIQIAQLGTEPVFATHEGLIGNVKGAPLRALTGPGITTTLLSVDALAKRDIGLYISGNATGNKVLFIDETRLQTQDEPFPEASIVHRGYKHNGEYLVELSVDPAHQPALFEAQSAIANKPPDNPIAHRGVNLNNLSLEQRIFLLHCRANHRSPEQLKALTDHHSEGSPVEAGVPIAKWQEATRSCPTCPLSKSTIRPHSHAPPGEPRKHTDKPYSYVHTDIKHMGNPSYGGSKYIANVVDDATNALHPLPLKQKSELTIALDTFHRRHIRPLGLKFDDIKLDRAGEQRSVEFEDMCANQGIRPHYTTAGDSQANGKVERANRTIATDILSNRIHCSMSRKAWAELSRASAAVHNLLPTTANPGNQSPTEMLNTYLRRGARKPNISTLRILGSKAFVHVNAKNRREGDNKSIEGTLVGYGDTLKTYRVMVKGSTTIIESDSVDIHEQIPGHADVISSIRPDTLMIAEPPPPAPFAQQPPAPAAPNQQPIAAAVPPDVNRIQVPPHLARFLDPELLLHADDIGPDDNDNAEQGPVHEQQGELFGAHQGEQHGEQHGEQPPPLQLPVVPGQAAGSQIPVWRGRPVQPRSQRQGGDSLSSLQKGSQPTAHFTSVVVPMVNHIEVLATTESQNTLLDPTHYAYVSKSLLETLPYSTAVKEPGAARGMLRELVNVVGERKLEIIKRPVGVSSITSTWTHKPQKEWKNDGEQSSKELRSRLCPRGYMQQTGSYNPDQIEAPTPRADSVRLFHALTVNRAQKVVLIDEKSAFSNTPLDTNDVIYMEFPDGMHNPNNAYILKMHNSINGIKQAANNYYRRTADHLITNEHFTRSRKDPCYFWKWCDNKRFLQVLAWVDDLRVAGDQDDDVDSFQQRFQDKFQCKVSDGSDYLGTNVFYDRAGGVLTVSVKKKVSELLDQFGMSDCRPVSTPAVPNTVLQRPEEGAAKDPEIQNYQYLSGVYSVYWLALIGKPEILYAVRDLSLYTGNYDASHVVAFKHVLRYLRGQLDNHLTLRRGTPGVIISRAYADADFAGSPERSPTPMRSTSGIALYLVGIGMLLAICKGQPTIARSTAEAEYRSSGLASVVVIDMNDFLEEIGFPQTNPTLIYQDNQACIKMTKSLVCGSKSRHIKIEHHYIRELVANNQIKLVFCPTPEMVADLFTKNLPKQAFEHLRHKLHHLL